MKTYSEALVRAARAVARLQTARRRLRRQLRQIETDLKVEKKHVRALMQELDDRRPDIVPSRSFGDGVGFVANVTRREELA